MHQAASGALKYIWAALDETQRLRLILSCSQYTGPLRSPHSTGLIYTYRNRERASSLNLPAKASSHT